MSEGRNDGLPPDWEELGREDADALAPPPGAKERVQRQVAMTLGLGAGFIAAAAATSTSAAASTGAAAGSATAGGATAAGVGTGVGSTGTAATGLAGTLLAKKVLLVGVAAAVGVGGGTATYLEVRSQRAAQARAPVITPPAGAPPIARPVAPPPTQEPEPAPPRETLGDERTLLDEARAEIVRGRLDEARSLLARHAEQFPTGRLSEEREALVIRLLVREGREGEARSRAARFQREHPHSIQLPGISDALRGKR